MHQYSNFTQNQQTYPQGIAVRSSVHCHMKFLILFQNNMLTYDFIHDIKYS